MLSMKQLIEATGESKSTIHYYLREGLLPEPKKPKHNVHHYDEKCVNIIKFIKHLQNKFSYSIADIKSVLSLNNFNFDGSFELLINSLDLISGSPEGKFLSEAEFLDLTKASKDKLEDFISKEFIICRAEGFTQKDAEMVKILLECESQGLDLHLIESYVKKAKELAKLEYEIGAKFLIENPEKHNLFYEMIFGVILSLKPYIFNSQSVKTHKENITAGGEKWKIY